MTMNYPTPSPWLAPRIGHLAMILALVTAAPVLQAEDAASYGDDYQTGDFGRVRYADSGVTIARDVTDAGAALDEAAEINALIFPGDVLRTAVRDRAEVQLARGGLIRIDRGSEVAFLALPDPYAELRDSTVIQLMAGALRISAKPDDREDEFRVDTPAASIYLLSEADVRIDIDGRGSTRVATRRGIVEVVGAGGSVLLRSGMETLVDEGAVPRGPSAFNTLTGDGFDRWVDEHDAGYRLRDAQAVRVYDQLPREVRPYHVELSLHGSWIQTTDYGYVWSPYGVASTWRPYVSGYWAWGRHGYYWVSYEPWGWAPYHYGRWVSLPGHGWGWVPGRVFAGAWVSWSWGPTWVGWCPLDYWNRPIFVSSVRYGGYDPGTWTFVHYSHVGRRHVARHAVSFDRVRPELGRTVVATRPPRVSPRHLEESSTWRERALTEARRNAVPRASAESRGPRLDQFEGRLRERAVGARREAGSAARAPREASRAGGTPSAGPRVPPGKDRRPIATYPRSERVSPPSGRRPADAPAPSRTRPGTASERIRSGRETSGNLQPRSVTPAERDGQQTSERLRGVYRQIAQPRATQDESESGGTPPRVEGRTPSRDTTSAGARQTKPPSPPAERARPGTPPSGAKPRETREESKPAPARGREPAGGRDGGAARSNDGDDRTESSIRRPVSSVAPRTTARRNHSTAPSRTTSPQVATPQRRAARPTTVTTRTAPTAMPQRSTSRSSSGTQARPAPMQAQRPAAAGPRPSPSPAPSRVQPPSTPKGQTARGAARPASSPKNNAASPRGRSRESR